MVFLNSRYFIGCSFLFLFLTNISISAFASVKTTYSKLDTDIQEAWITGEIRIDYRYSDHGLEKQEYRTETTKLELSHAAIGVYTQLSAFSFLDILYSLATEEPEYAYIFWQVLEGLSIEAGYSLINQGGWDVKDDSFRRQARGLYVDYAPFPVVAPQFSLAFNAAGKVTIQITDDVILESDNSAYSYWNKEKKQPALLVEWLGTFGPIKPLLQMGSYDMSHSKFFVLGFKANLAALEFSYDFLQDMRSAKVVQGEKTKKVEGILRQSAVNMSYSFGTIKPTIHISKYEYNQPNDPELDPRLIDIQGNYLAEADEGPYMDDNGLIWAVSINYIYDENWQPFVAAVGRSGRWLAEEGGTEKREDLQMKIGFLGSF